MKIETALKINKAACAVWFFKQGYSPQLSTEDVCTIKKASVGQIQTAAEIMEAADRDTPAVDGRRSFYGLDGAEVVAQVKEFVNSLPGQ